MTDDSYPLTNFLIGANMLAYVAVAMSGYPRLIVDTYGFNMEHVLAARWDVFLTAGFLHSGLAHLLYNMFFLWVFGRACEDMFGWSKTASIYAASMITGSLFFGLLFPGEVAVGASGAVSGLVAAAILVEPGRDIYPANGSMPIVLLAVLFLIPTMLNAFNLAGNTANIAHVGGVFAGAVLALLWQPQRSIANMKRLWPLWAGIAVIVAVLVVQVI